MRRWARKGGGRQVELAIAMLGGKGDGIGTLDGRPVFVGQTLPGERVLARVTAEKSGGWRGEAFELLSAAAERVDPPCPHFGPCGGCALQHLAPADYRRWKRGLLLEALTRQNLPTEPVASLISLGERGRRRAVFAARRVGEGLVLGFHRRMSHEVVDLSTCLLVTPSLFALLAPLRLLLAQLLRRGDAAEITVTETLTGPDILLTLADAPDLAGREAVVAFAESVAAARICWRSGEGATPEPLALLHPPQLRFGEVAVTPPPGGFLQPTAEGEAALLAAVLAGLPEGAARIADLYAGCGTFTFPLAARGKVLAVEGDGPALEALAAAARGAGLIGRVTAQARDLTRQPLRAAELAGFDAVVFDPPRIGAREQAQELAQSQVPRLLAVSCNPVTLSRDLRILVEGGYRIDEILSVDQFPWSAHLEIVARLSR